MNVFNNKFFLNHLKDKDLISYNANSLSDVKQEKLNHIFRTNDVSYIPIIRRDSECLGVVSRKKYFFSILDNKKFDIKSLIIEMLEVDMEDSLEKTLLKLKNESGLLLKIDGKIRKFISPRVVSNAFATYSYRYMMIEKVEIAIRKYINKNIIDFIELLKEKKLDKKSNKKQKEINDLLFYDYITIFGSAWETLDFFKNRSADRKMFLFDLSQIAELRNDLLHFRNNLEFDENIFKNILNFLKQ